MIIDAHAHITDGLRGMTRQGPTRSLTHGKVQWGDEQTRFLPPLNPSTTCFPPEILLENMDWAGVDKAVLLQGSWYGEANAYVAEAMRKWPDRFLGAAFVDPRSPEARETFRRATEELGFRILKFELSEPTGLVGVYPDLRIDEESMAWIWEEAERQQLVVTLDLGGVGSLSYQTEAVRALLGRHPRLTIVIAHLAQPPVAQCENQRLDRLWQEQVQLARHPRVWLDLSALPAYVASIEGYPYPTARQYIRRAVEMVGVEKIMWATDAPALLLYGTYPQLLDFVAKHCDFLSRGDLEKILGGNASQVYEKDVRT